MRNAIITLLIIIGTGCASHFEPEWDLSGKPLTVTTTLFQTERELNQHLMSRYGEAQLSGTKGFAVASSNGECRIYALTSSSGPSNDTIGHELKHCLFGRYHGAD